MQHFLEKIKSFTKKAKVAEKKPLFEPYHDWAVLFGSASLLLVLLFIVNAYFFFAIQDGIFFGLIEEAPTTSRKYNHDELDKMLTHFLERGFEFEALKDSPPVIVDPSK